MKQSEFIRMLTVAHDVPNGYNNKYPKNLGYFDGKKYTFDCWNLIKVVLAGWKPTGIVGSFTKPTVTGDITGAAILAKCHDRSKDFSKICVPGTYLYMQKPAHAGVYLGDFNYNGKIYNVVECTTSFGGGVVYSWVDSDGTRRKYKGSLTKSYKWTDYGLLPWVIYESGSPYMIKGYDYSPVFNPMFYAEKYNDLRNAFGYDETMLWNHFVQFGMNEMRQASAEFNPNAYINRYPDVKNAYGGSEILIDQQMFAFGRVYTTNDPLYYFHYIAFGKNEGRQAN